MNEWLISRNIDSNTVFVDQEIRIYGLDDGDAWLAWIDLGSVFRGCGGIAENVECQSPEVRLNACQFQPPLQPPQH